MSDATPSQSRIESLSQDACLHLLSSKHAGRVAWCGSRGPQVMPVNYVVVDRSVYFRTAEDSSITKALYESHVAFQVDDIDEFLRSAWSVLVVGTATYVHDESNLPAWPAGRPDTWAPGDRRMYIRIDPDEITGRQVHSS